MCCRKCIPALSIMIVLLLFAGTPASAQTVGQTMLKNVEGLYQDALFEQALQQIDPVIQLLQQEVAGGQSPAESLAHAHYLKANTFMALGKSKNEIKQELMLAQNTAPGYKPQNYISHPEIKKLLAEINKGVGPVEEAGKGGGQGGGDYTAEYNMAVKLFGARQYCAVITILSPIANNTPNPKQANKMLAESQKRCKQAPVPVAACPPAPMDQKVLVMPVVYRDENASNSSRSLVGALTSASIASSLKQYIPSMTFCAVSDQMAASYREKLDENFKWAWQIKEWASFVIKKNNVTLGGVEKLPECGGLVLQAMGQAEQARYFMFIRVASPQVSPNALFLNADMDLNIYDLQFEEGRKLKGVTQVLNIASKDELAGKMDAIVQFVKTTLGK